VARRIVLALASLAEIVLSVLFLLAIMWVAACRSTWPEPIRAQVVAAYVNMRLDGTPSHWLELAWEDADGVNRTTRKHVTFSEYNRFSTRAEVCLYELPGGDIVLRNCP
jgi:hypothetical protein